MNVKITEHEGITFLWINGKMWMWDLPEEVKIQKQLADQCYGDVLVAGYGLGILQMYLSESRHIQSVITVEKEPEVIKVCIDHYKNIYGGVTIRDFFDIEPKTVVNKWDCIVGDFWIEIHPDGLPCYKKFRERAEELIKPHGKILGWGMDYYEYLINCEGV